MMEELTILNTGMKCNTSETHDPLVWELNRGVGGGEGFQVLLVFGEMEVDVNYRFSCCLRMMRSLVYL